MDVDTSERLKIYFSLLIKWQKTINLVAPGTVANAWTRHFEDSLQLLPLLDPNVKTIVDIGSGAGFPGLAVALVRPDISVHLIESDTRKCAFLSSVSRETGVSNVTIHTTRIEVGLPEIASVDAITARALAPLPQLLKLTQNQWERHYGIRMFFLKGKEWQDEIIAAQLHYTFICRPVPSVTQSDAAVLCISNIANKA